MYCSLVSGGESSLCSVVGLCGAGEIGHERAVNRRTLFPREREREPPNNNMQINILHPHGAVRTLLYITRLYIKSSSRSVAQERPACILQRPIAHEPLSVLSGQFASRYNPGFVSYMSTYETDAA